MIDPLFASSVQKGEVSNRAFDFHSANAALGLIMLTLRPFAHVLPHERQQVDNH